MLDIKMCEKFDWKYLNTSETILSLYHKTIEHASSSLNSNIMEIKAQLNCTQITVFIISIYVTKVKFSGLDDQGFNRLARARNFSHSKNVQMGSLFTHPPIGGLSPRVKWLQQKAAHSHHLLQRLRMSGPTVILSHMP